MKLNAAMLCLILAPAYAQNTPESGRQGLTVQVDGTPVGTHGILNFESGNGITEVCREDVGRKRVTCTPSYNSAVVATHSTVHNNENYCVSTNGTTAYTCHLPYSALISYRTGMTLTLVTDATCAAGCTLNVDGAGIVSIKKIDGSTDPAGTLVAGQPQWIFYDGKVFRLMGSGTAAAAGSQSNARDVIARRVIASMETMTYAPKITLEVTAGDLHKTTTTEAVGNATINAATGGLPGQHMWIIVVNDVIHGKKITFGEHLKSVGPLTGTPGKSATLQFISDGTAWYEVARTTNL